MLTVRWGFSATFLKPGLQPFKNVTLLVPKCIKLLHDTLPLQIACLSYFTRRTNNSSASFISIIMQQCSLSGGLELDMWQGAPVF